MTVAPQTGWPPTFGRYLLYGEIASGGMATVHFGRLQGAAGFARSVAIKRLHPQYAKDPDFVAMFLDEARLAARIAHPNVVPTLDVVAQGDELLLVMEYVRGSALSRLLRTLTQRGERMPPRVAAAIAAGVLRGLHAAHEAKSETGDALDIVHRDVSPQNVLVGTDGIARLLDFGVAKAAGRVQTTREGQLKGKLAYMAPEQITTGAVTRKTDVYAAAVVLWEMLTGRRLFRAENEAKLLSLVLDSEVLAPSKLVDGLAEGFDQVVLRGLDRDPAKRYATAREMAIEVEAVTGIAPPTEVGEWVEVVAADELRERANRIEEIERSMQGSSPSAVSNHWALAPAARPSGVARRADEASTAQHGARALAAAAAPAASSSAAPPSAAPATGNGASTSTGSQVSQVSRLSASNAERRPASRTRSVGILAAVLAVAAIGAAVFAFHPSRSSAKVTPSIGAPGSTATTPPHSAPGAEAPAPAPAPAPPPASSIASAQPVRPVPGPAASGPGGAMSDAQSFTSSKPPARPLWGQQPQLPTGQVPAPRRPAAPDCNPPYTTDEKGHIHFKPACVN
ncbi:MAG TPA: serine/threonine-protein kinase [Polyangiaceae bacterium]|nr:serine/threonine-protein kinase [Polyangiaceae bacterium]